MDERDRERFLDEIWPAAERAARARGMDDEEIAQKREQVLDLLDHAPKRGDVIHRDTSVDRLSPSAYGDSPIIRRTFQRSLLRVLFVGVFALLGYFGMPAVQGGRVWHPGLHGLVYGTAFGLGVLVFAESFSRTRRRERL